MSGALIFRKLSLLTYLYVPSIYGYNRLAMGNLVNDRKCFETNSGLQFCFYSIAIAVTLWYE